MSKSTRCRSAPSAPVRLTKLELRLLQMLIANAGHTVSSDRLLMQVWGHKGSGDRQLLKQLVHRLRQKIEIDPAAPQMLQTAPGAGYKLDRRLTGYGRTGTAIRDSDVTDLIPPSLSGARHGGGCGCCDIVSSAADSAAPWSPRICCDVRRPARRDSC